jgi:hypothetical protein
MRPRYRTPIGVEQTTRNWGSYQRRGPVPQFFGTTKASRSHKRSLSPHLPIGSRQTIFVDDLPREAFSLWTDIGKDLPAVALMGEFGFPI